MGTQHTYRQGGVDGKEVNFLGQVGAIRLIDGEQGASGKGAKRMVT